MKRIILASGLLFMVFSHAFAGWVIETVDSEGYVGEFNSLALDDSNNPHISYTDADGGSLNYAYFDGSSWLIINFYPVGMFTSIVLDSFNAPHISYHTDSGLDYAYFDGSNWQISNVDSNGDTGWETSIALDSLGNPHISYLDNTNGDLKYAFYDGSDWQISTLDSEDVTGYNPSLALDSFGNPHISYHHYSYGYLMYVYFDGSDWQISVADSQGNLGDYSSIALDNYDHPHISYYDWYPNHDLKYASYDGSNWQVSTIDSEGVVGQYTSIALDSSDHPHISYFDWTNDNLKYAFYDGSTWQISTVDSDGHVGEYTSLKLDSFNQPHISYFSGFPNYDLKYAHFVDDSGVSLLSFTAQPQPNSAIKLVWQVSASDDTQIVGFNLYRSGAGKARKKDWTRLNSSPITGNNPYQFVDASVQAGQGYHYRLSALTADGKEEMLGTAQGEAGTTPAMFALTAVYPNPAATLLTCRLTMPQAGEVSLGLYDISGRLVLSKRLDLSGGEQETALEVGNLAKGIYTVRASSRGESVTKRIVVIR